MASDALPVMGVGDDPRMQVINITGFDGEPIPIPLNEITAINQQAVRVAIVYSSQIGACFIMLVVLLTMTPKHRFARLPTLINIANLALAVARMTLLAYYYASSWLEMYTFYSGDVTYVKASDMDISIAGTALSIPQTILILSALVVQAWSMVQLWTHPWKWAAILVSAVMSLAAFCFRCVSLAIQIRIIKETFDVTPFRWIRLVDVSLMTSTISWFCFLFNVRLVMHMWVNRSILPTRKGLSSMDVLVMANGLLMFIPVIFAGLQFSDDIVFLESGSLVATSAVLALPLAALVAQRYSAGRPSQHRGSRDTDEKTLDGSKRRFLEDYSHRSTTKGSGGTSGNRYYPSAATLSTKVASGLHVPPAGPKRQHTGDPIDLELQRIDDDDDIHFQENQSGGVRVNRSIERREERI